VVFSIVLLSLFILALVQVFDVTFKAYQYNRLQAAKLYAKTNIDGLFNIIEEELKYSGSNLDIVKQLYSEDIDPIKINVTGNQISTQYALSEKIILQKDPVVETGKYWALFPADIPKTRIDEGDGLWSLHYDDLNNPSSSTPTLIESMTAGTDETNGRRYITITIDGSDWGAYISPLLYEKAVGFLSDTIPYKTKIEINPGNDWYGEIIYRTRIYLESANPTSGEASSIKMERHIPTIDASYTVNILDNVEEFRVGSSDNIYTATVVYIVPEFDATFTKARNFYNWRE